MPTLLQQARFVLGELGIRPHKRLGQHFLIDASVIDQLVQAAGIGPQDTVLEIGPGLGALSEALVERAGQLYVVEVDRILADRLHDRFARSDRVHVIHADFLRLDLPTAFPPVPMNVVASLPYNVATPILFRLLEHRRQFPQATVMLQQEVAERVAAVPGTKAYGVLSILIQLHATIKPICTVGARSFFPAPKVTSQILHIAFHETLRVGLKDDSLFRRVVKAAFSQRRKTLRNALRSLGDVEAVGRVAGIDLNRRGETLSIEEFAVLANVFAEAV